MPAALFHRVIARCVSIKQCEYTIGQDDLQGFVSLLSLVEGDEEECVVLLRQSTGDEYSIDVISCYSAMSGEQMTSQRLTFQIAAQVVTGITDSLKYFVGLPCRVTVPSFHQLDSDTRSPGVLPTNYSLQKIKTLAFSKQESQDIRLARSLLAPWDYLEQPAPSTYYHEEEEEDDDSDNDEASVRLGERFRASYEDGFKFIQQENPSLETIKLSGLTNGKGNTRVVSFQVHRT